MARNYASPASDDPLVATFRHKKHVFGRQGKNPAAVQDAAIRRALANERRLLLLEWLKAPLEHFPPQVAGDLIEDGVCGCSSPISWALANRPSAST